jgi:hypothetical protein
MEAKTSAAVVVQKRVSAVLLAVALFPLGCVLWPEGAGPGAAAVPLAEALVRRDRGEAVLIDVRSREAYAAGHIPGALNLASNEIESQAAAIRKMNRLPILYCG